MGRGKSEALAYESIYLSIVLPRVPDIKNEPVNVPVLDFHYAFLKDGPKLAAANRHSPNTRIYLSCCTAKPVK